MMLSVCIPVYNFDVRPLVSDLRKEISLKNLSVEILVLDDASEAAFKALHQNLEADLYLELPKNLGRARIRNRFSDFAKGEFLLFLDGDGGVVSPDFLEKWLKQLGPVVYGGRQVPEPCPTPQQSLRWTYARKRENPPAAHRKQNPYLTFQTNNFLVEKAVFQQNLFDPNFNGYGYEDLLFALNFKRAGIPIQHIENPVLNRDMETNAVFVEKSRQAAQSLARMLNAGTEIREIRLARVALFLTKWKLAGPVRLGFTLFKKRIQKRLEHPDPPLFWLDVWKLGWTLRYISSSLP